MNEQNNGGLKVNYWFLMAIFGLMLVGGIVTIVFFVKTNSLANKNMAATAEANRPANLDITTITDNTCADCFNINPLLDSIKKENVKITNQKTLDKNSDEAKQLIKEFAIKKLPTIIVKGELTKNKNLATFFSKAGDTTGGTFVFRQVGSPYELTDTGEVKGRIKLTLLADTTCTTCYDVSQHETILRQFGIITTGTVVDTKSAAGQALIHKYGIKLVPTFVLSGDVASYPDLKTIWSQVGVVAYDGAYVFTKGIPFMGIYKDLSTNRVITPPPPTTTPQQQ